MTKISGAQEILHVVERFRALGYRETRHRVRLFGRVPHVAPQAWFHSIPQGLTRPEIDSLSESLGLKVPADYSRFLQAMNGAHLFSDNLALYGMRPFSGRDVDSAFLPYDIVDANTYERPQKLRREMFIIGVYSDGSRLAMDSVTGRVERIRRNGGPALNVWPSLEAFLHSELHRIDALYNDEGRLVSEGASLTP